MIHPSDYDFIRYHVAVISMIDLTYTSRSNYKFYRIFIELIYLEYISFINRYLKYILL